MLISSCVPCLACQVPNPAFDVAEADGAPNDPAGNGADDVELDAAVVSAEDGGKGDEDVSGSDDANKEAPDARGRDALRIVDDAEPPPNPPDAAAKDAKSVPDASPSGTPVIVAVGDGEMRLVSTDLGKTWQLNNFVESTSDRDSHFGVGYAGGLFFAMGWRVWRSSDAVTWSEVVLPSPQWFKSVAYGDGHFMMGGGYGTLAVSHDGETWTLVRGPNTEAVDSVAYLDGRFAIGLRSEEVFVTTDRGRSWQRLSGLVTPFVVACDGSFRTRAECGWSSGTGWVQHSGHGVSIRFRWPTLLERSTDGMTFTDAFAAPVSTRGVAFGFRL